MKAFAGIIFVIFHVQCISAFVIERLDGESELVSVAVLFRHGDKTPTTSFPNDPYFDLSYWPLGRGQLTNKGKKRHFDLGKWFRNRYSTFLPEEYSVKDIYVRSTDVDRTLMSAAANLAGLYPPKNSQIWNKILPWQPIPIHTIPTEEDQVLYMDSKCPKFTKLYDEAYSSEFFMNINKQYADFYKEVSNFTGWDITDVHFFAQLQSALYVYENYNSSYLPSWADSLDQDKLNYLAGLNYARYTFTRELKRLGVGPFFDNLFTRFDSVVNSTADSRKFLMLSAHESTVASVLNSMGVFDYRAPAFASCLIWELRKSTNGVFYINLFYKKNSTDAVDILEVKSCGLNCAYDNYKSILKPITIDMATWKDECKLVE
ncbi:hypothetical protein NQ314_014697 [Rhamnusium bicolor]|uniref:acid phosphatase n=1 Tax=Rhamnusium bicolor TaxID=1586634 RepID=A0AAV8X1C0_9CUCU|nr:hypothetical protein NQ314_014697 [Rhamnusium bicolor]